MERAVGTVAKEAKGVERVAVKEAGSEAMEIMQSPKYPHRPNSRQG